MVHSVYVALKYESFVGLTSVVALIRVLDPAYGSNFHWHFVTRAIDSQSQPLSVNVSQLHILSVYCVALGSLFG